MKKQQQQKKGKKKKRSDTHSRDFYMNFDIKKKLCLFKLNKKF